MFGSISTRIAAYAAGALALVMVVVAVFALMGADAAKRQNRELRADLVTTNQAWGECRADLSTARGQVEEQSAQVRAWKAQAAQVQKDADAKVARARQEAAQYRRRAERLSAIPTPSAGQCEAAAALYVQVVSEDRK